MRLRGETLVLSATDLANFLYCRHLSGLDLAAAGGKLKRPHFDDPLLELLVERGKAHEQAYVDSLAGEGHTVADLGAHRTSREDTITRTVDAMRAGTAVIVQGALGNEHWFGYPDILRRIERPSALGAWSYEVVDTKLARTTRAGMILQLCLYSDLLGVTLGSPPEYFHIVTPDPVTPKQTFRVEDYAAYFRLVQRQFLTAIGRGADELMAGNYPEPVEHCEVCAWSSVCNRKRHADDHPSLIAGISRTQRRELEGRGVTTLADVAGVPLPITFKPQRGSKESYAKVREQARVQLASRGRTSPLHELIDCEPGFGLARLPEPSPGDVFLDLEGDPFAAEGGREYLFGLVTVEADNSTRYQAYWAFTEAEERAAFEQAMDLIMAARSRAPDMHVFHYAPYEPSAFKRLAGRHATRDDELDQLLREERFVDLLAVVRQGVRVGVESYSIKRLEPLYGFDRVVPLETANRCLKHFEVGLETGAAARLPDEIRAGVAGYNEDDCVTTLRLRDWLENLRTEAVAAGKDIQRPVPKSADPQPDIGERARQVEGLRGRLLAGVPVERAERNEEQEGRWILAYLLDWHRREDRAGWWEYFRLRDLPEEELHDERKAVAGLEFLERVGPVAGKRGKPTKSMIDRYGYPPQEMEIGPKDNLKLQDGTDFGSVVSVDRDTGTIDVAKGPSRAGLHPSAAFEHSHVSPKIMEAALLALGERVAADGRLDVEGGRPGRLARDLLLRRGPRLRSIAFDGTATAPAAIASMALDLDDSVLAIQGPPGSGKTYCGARMILAAVQAGKRVGITATSHKVIDNLLIAVASAAAEARAAVALGHRDSDDGDPVRAHGLVLFADNESARDALADGAVQVLGGTVWLWAREDMREAVDLLFVDEAGQISLANTLAASSAARSLVLLGDPQQLDQPIKGSHPPGADGSALSHMLGGHRTMPENRGLFLPETRRLAPSISDYTSAIFYEGKLRPLAGLEHQVLGCREPFTGSGLWAVDVRHDGNRNHSEEEVDAVEWLVSSLTANRATWTDATGMVRPLGGSDILVVAPYNAQVSRLVERLDGSGVRVGTVDKFQGQEAPVVIYSMATSRAEDAPRGMEFLYSPNRLNVATSRARCAAILVASPRLYEPDCRSPRQMQLANALCRFREMAIALP